MGGLNIRMNMTKESVTLKMEEGRKEGRRKESNLMKRDINDWTKH